MLNSFTLANWKSFGEQQEVPLSPITVLVGPNNSGKSNFLSAIRFARNAMVAGPSNAETVEGGVDALRRRDQEGWHEPRFIWQVGDTSYSCSSKMIPAAAPAVPYAGSLSAPYESVWVESGARYTRAEPSQAMGAFLGWGHREAGFAPSSDAVQSVLMRKVIAPIVAAKEVKLVLDSLRTESDVVPSPQLSTDGLGLAAVIALWRGADPDRAQSLDEFLRKCVPELRSVLVRPSPTKAGKQQLSVRFADKTEFRAPQLSDGLLMFIALAAHVVGTGPGSLLLIEEPEQCIHPKRVHELVDLLRTAVTDKQCQVILTTHSPTLLDEFRDQPEAILRFSRSETGTKVRRLSEDEALVQALREFDGKPGEMLVNGMLE